MDPSPTEKAERCKRIVAACAALKRTILESPQISNVFRDIGRRLLRRMRASNLPDDGSSHKADLLRLSRLMEMEEWAVELEGIRKDFLLGGKVVAVLVTAKVAPCMPAPHLVAERFLGPLKGFSSGHATGDVECCPEWPEEVRRAAETLSDLRGSAADFLRQWFDENIERPIEHKHSANSLKRALSCALNDTCWDEETREVFNLFEPTLECLRSVAVDTVTLKGGIPAWHTAEIFLLGRPTTGLAAMKRDLRYSLELSCEKWLPGIYLASGPKISDRPSTGQEPLDEQNTIDQHRKSIGQGQTKKPRSHHDNRGHK